MSTPVDNELTPAESGARLPSLGSPEVSVGFLARVKEILETLLGRRGRSNWDRAVTFRDLYNMGVNVDQLSGYGGPLTINAQSRAIIDIGQASNGASQIKFDALLRQSLAYKELRSSIGSVEGLAVFPDEFRSQLQTALAAIARDRQSDIRTVLQKVQTNSVSMASRLDEITAAIDQTAAGVRQFDASYADDLRALSVSIKQVTASLGNIGNVTIEEKFLAQAEINEGLRGQWSLKIQSGTESNPIIAGIALSLEGPTADETTSGLTFLADDFGFYTQNGKVMPFGIDGATGKIYVNGQLIVNGVGKTLSGALQDAVNYIGEFAAPPAPNSYNLNDIYKNTSDGNTYIISVSNGVKSWALWISRGEPGPQGDIGPRGLQGLTGARGTVDIAASGYSAWDDTAATNVIANAGYGSPQERDRVTLYGTNFSQTRFRSNGSWLTIAAYINGNMVVDGTLVASKISAGLMTGQTIQTAADNTNGRVIINEASSNSLRVYFAANNTAVIDSTPGASNPALKIRYNNSGAAGLDVINNNNYGILCSGSNGIGASGYNGGGWFSSTAGNAVNITGGVNGIAQSGGGGNFLFSILPSVDNAFSLGENGTYRWTGLYASSGTITTSDARTKTEVQDSDLGLDFIVNLRPVRYKQLVAQNVVKEVASDFVGPAEEGYVQQPNLEITPRPGVRVHYGFIAQEVRAAIASAGPIDAAMWSMSDPLDENSLQSLRYEELIGPMVKAIQELKQVIETQQEQIDELRSQLAPS